MPSKTLRVIALVAVTTAIVTAVVALLVLREPISMAALSMNPDTGELISSEVSTGFRYPSPGQVAMLALLAGGIAAVAVMAWDRRSALAPAARRKLRPSDLGHDDLDGDGTDLLDSAPVEILE